MALTQTQVSQLYVSIFGRASEGEGNTYWQTEGASLEDAATKMLATDAAATYFGDSLDTNQAFIEHIYENTLGKTYAEDTEGVDYWVSLLEGGATRGEVVARLVEAAQAPENAGAAQDQFNNKVAVSDYVADTIATADVNDLSAFTAYVANVTDDSATVDSAKESADAAALQPLIDAAAQATYDDNKVQADSEATSVEKAASTLAKEEAVAAAIDAGATQSQIDDATDTITAENAAADTLADIVALAEANEAVSNGLAALDASYDANEDEEITVAEVDAAFAATLTNGDSDGYNDLASTNITVSGDLAGEDLDVPTAEEIADIHTANIAGLNAALTVQKAEEAVEQAKVDAIDGLEAKIDAAQLKAEAYTTAFKAEAATEKAEAMALAAADAASAGTVTVNADGTILDSAMISVVTTDGVAATSDESSVVTFENLVAGQSVTIDGVTLTVSEDTLAADVATAFKAAYDAATSTKLFTAAAPAGADITFTSTTTNTNVDDITISIDGTEDTNAGITDLKAAIAADAAADKSLSDADTALTNAVQDVIRTELDSTTATPGTAAIAVDAEGNVTLDYTDTTGGGTAAAAPITNGLLTEKAQTVAAEKAITDLEAAKAEFDAALVDAQTILPLLEAQTEAETNLVGEVTLADAATETGTLSTQDVYFIDALEAGNSAEISGNGVESGTDYIYVGTDFAVNTDLEAGDDSLLEMFITEGTTENDTLLTFETKAFGSNSAGDFYTVELTGVKAEDISVEDGLITIA